MIISFISIPGSGKSTHIKMLKESNKSFNFVELSVKYLCEDKIKSYIKYLKPKELETIEQLKEKNDICKQNGILSPIKLDEIMFKLVIRLYKSGQNILLDGAPRGLEQAEIFYKLLQDEGIKDYKIINLDFITNQIKNSRHRQLLRIMSKKITLKEKYLKSLRIYNKIDVYINDTKRGLQYLENAGVSILKINAADDISKNNKLITDYILISD